MGVSDPLSVSVLERDLGVSDPLTVRVCWKGIWGFQILSESYCQCVLETDGGGGGQILSESYC